MTQVLFPISEFANTGWAIAGTGPAATTWESIDEGMSSPDEDITILATATNGSVNNVNMSPALAPATTGGVVFEARLRERGAVVPNTLMTIELRSAADGLIAQRVSIGVVGTTWTTHSFTCTGAEEALITDWANLRLRVVMATTASAQVRYTTGEVRVPDPPPGLRGWFFPMWRHS